MGEVLTWWLLVSRWTGGGLLSPDVLQYVDAYRQQAINTLRLGPVRPFALILLSRTFCFGARQQTPELTHDRALLGEALLVVCERHC